MKPFPPPPGTLLNGEEVRARVEVLRQTKVFPAEDDTSPASTSRTPRKTAAASGHGKKEEMKIEYGDQVEFAVLRCLAAFPNTAAISRPVSKHDGLYPLATIHNDVLKLGCTVGFDRFKYALEQAEILYPTLTEEERLEMLNDSFDDQITSFDRDAELHENFRRNWEVAQAPDSEVPAGAEREAAPPRQGLAEEEEEEHVPQAKGRARGKAKAKPRAGAQVSEDGDEWVDTDVEEAPLSPAPSKRASRGRGKAKAKKTTPKDGNEADAMDTEANEVPVPASAKAKRPAKRPRTTSDVSVKPQPKRRR